MITIIILIRTQIFDDTVPGDNGIGEKENEDVEEYHELK